jgi:hypothetical protein
MRSRNYGDFLVDHAALLSKATDDQAALIVPGLIKAADSINEIVCLRGVIALGMMGLVAKDAVPILARHARSKQTQLRYEATKSLGGIGYPSVEVMNALIYALEDGEPHVVREAAESLGRLLPAVRITLPKLFARAVSELGELMEEESNSAAANALWGIDPEGRREVRLLLEKLFWGDRKYSSFPSVLNAMADLTHVVVDQAQRYIIDETCTLVDRSRVTGSLIAYYNSQIRNKDSLNYDPNDVIMQITSVHGNGAALVGIEVMGDEAVRLIEALDTFRRIGQICQERGNGRFTFTEMQRKLGLGDSTIQNHIDYIIILFHNYFNRFHGIVIAEDTDRGASTEQKLFDRGQGKKPAICDPLGWRAWELTCRFLERREQTIAERRRAARQNG